MQTSDKLACYELEDVRGARVLVKVNEVRRVLENEQGKRPHGTLFGQPLSVLSALVTEYYRRGGRYDSTPEAVRAAFNSGSVLLRGGRAGSYYTVDLEKGHVVEQRGTTAEGGAAGPTFTGALRWEQRRYGQRRLANVTFAGPDKRSAWCGGRRATDVHRDRWAGRPSRRLVNLIRCPARREGRGRRATDVHYCFLPWELRVNRVREQRRRLANADRRQGRSYPWAHRCLLDNGKLWHNVTNYCPSCGMARNLQVDRRGLHARRALADRRRAAG